MSANDLTIPNWFIKMMEAKLRENDDKGGWSIYTGQSDGFLLNEAILCTDRLDDCPKEDRIKWAVNLANFAMMIAYRERERQLLEAQNLNHDE